LLGAPGTAPRFDLSVQDDEHALKVFEVEQELVQLVDWIESHRQLLFPKEQVVNVEFKSDRLAGT
jgi:hypothetical protein